MSEKYIKAVEGGWQIWCKDGAYGEEHRMGRVFALEARAKQELQKVAKMPHMEMYQIQCIIRDADGREFQEEFQFLAYSEEHAKYIVENEVAEKYTRATLKECKVRRS